MNESEFLERLNKIIPNLVYNKALLESESIEIPIYFSGDDEIMLDFEGMREEFENKLTQISELLEGDKDE